MSEEGEKRKDPGDIVREGVRSVIGILGALKDAVEESFEDLRNGGDASPDSPGSANEPEAPAPAARSPFEAAQEAVDDVRERLDFVPRRDFDALAAEVAELRGRMDAFGAPRAEGEDTVAQTGGPEGAPWAQAPSDASDSGSPGGQAEPPTGQPDTGADEQGTRGTGADFRFEVE